MTSKIRIKVGAVELEYEGEEEFLKKELLGLLESMVRLHKGTEGDEEYDAGRDTNRDQKPRRGGGGGAGPTTATIAGKLKVKNGPGLILAACAHLALVAKKQVLEREDILREMKTASTYYKKTYNNNLSSYLKRMVTGKHPKLNEVSGGKYSLTEASRKNLEAAIGR